MIIVFYAVPPLLSGTRFFSFASGVFIPSCCIGCAIVFGKVHGFRWYYWLVTVLVYVPSVFINYSRFEIKSVIMYGMIALMGNLIGSAFHREKY